MSVAEENNNPGNIRPPKGMTYKGQIGVDDRGFAIFQNYADGRNALIHDIQVKQKNGINTPHSFIDKYTPAGQENKEESRDNYKIGMAGHLGLKSTNESFPENSAEKIADFIEQFESGKAPNQTQQATANPNNPFAVGVPLADKAREASTTEGTTDTPPPAEEVVSPMAGAAVGAGSASALQIPFDPQMPAKAPDLTTLQDAADKAKRRADIAQNRLGSRVNSAMPIEGGTDLATLEAEYKRSQFMLEKADKELKAAEASQKAKVAPAPAITPQSAPEAGSMASVTPQIITDPNAPMSRTATEQMMQGTIDPNTGTTGRQRQNYNEVTSFRALQAAEQQKALEQAAKSGVVPDSGQSARLAFGMPDATPSGIIVQPEVAAPLKQQAELEKKIADDKAAQERLAQQQEMNRLKNEKLLASQQHSQAQTAFNQAQRAKTSGVTRAQSAAETALDRASAAKQDLEAGQTLAKTAPSGLNRPLEITGVKAGKAGMTGRAIVGGLGGLQAARGINDLSNIPVQELIQRFNAGDRSPELMQALQKAAGATAQTGFGAAATLPVMGPKTARLKGAGVIGTLGMGAYQGMKALTE